MMCFMVYMYTKKFGVLDESTGSGGGKKKAGGVLEGIKLFIDHNFVKGIFFISCFFMIEVTILDYSMKILAKEEFDAEYPGDQLAATKAFAAFMGRFGQATNTLSFSFSLLGTSFIIRRLGLNYTIIAFPSCCFAAICAVYLYPNLMMVFAAMLMLKGFSYSLNNPCKEILYRVTSKGTKFKAKSWIDVFGARGSKATGSIVTNAFSDSASDLLTYGAYVAMGVSSFLIFVAYKMGQMFDEYIETGYIVGEEQPTAEELAQKQQLEGDTSLGIAEEGQEDAGTEQQVKV